MSNRNLPSTNTRARREVAALDPQLADILGPPPIMESDDLDAYNSLHDQVRSTVAPVDVIEELWVRDVVDLVWETLRLRRLKMKLMTAAAHHGLNRVLEPLVGYLERDELVEGWSRREKSAVKEVNALLKNAGHDQETIVAQTLSAKLDDFERIDRMITQAEGRRNAALREIDRHRDAVARRLREAVTDIEDAEFEDVSGPKGKAAA